MPDNMYLIYRIASFVAVGVLICGFIYLFFFLKMLIVQDRLSFPYFIAKSSSLMVVEHWSYQLNP